METFSRFKNHMDAVNGVLLVNREDTYHFLTYLPKLAVRNEQLLFHGPFGKVIPVNRFNPPDPKASPKTGSSMWCPPVISF
jgi:hypothetical protein